MTKEQAMAHAILIAEKAETYQDASLGIEELADFSMFYEHMDELQARKEAARIELNNAIINFRQAMAQEKYKKLGILK